MRQYKLALSQYGVQPKRYDELKAVCKQYPDWKQEIISLYQLKGVAFDGMPHSTTPGNPTEQAVLKLEKLKSKKSKVERAAKVASPEQWEKVIKNVSDGTPYKFLNYYGGINQFYEARARFFVELNKIWP